MGIAKPQTTQVLIEFEIPHIPLIYKVSYVQNVVLNRFYTFFFLYIYMYIYIYIYMYIMYMYLYVCIIYLGM